MTTLPTLKEKFKEGTIDRRTFVHGALGLGVAASSLPTLIRDAEASTPKRGGTLRMGLASGSTTDSMDPALINTNFDQVWCYGCLRNGLTLVNQNGGVDPDLAESWESTPDAKTWRFKLRSGLEFHNGKSVTVEDVVGSVNHHRSEESKSSIKALLADVEDLSTDGNNVVFNLASGNADFAALMADQKLGIMPVTDGKADAVSGIGTGAYKVESFEPGVAAHSSRFANHHRSDAGFFDAVSILPILDAAARSNALTTGDIDYMDRCDLKTIDLLKRNSNLVVTVVEGNLHYVLPMNTNVAPFDSNDVRLALKYGIDREAMLNTILRGYGTVGNDHPIGPAYRYSAKDLEQRAYDPDKAKFHLKRAGLDTLTVQLSIANTAFPGAIDAAVLYREQAAKCGIEIDVVREADDSYWNAVWLKKPWCGSYWAGRPTEDLMFSLAYAKDAKWNETGWDNARFNELLLTARSELDEAKRRDMYGEMQRILWESGGALIPVFANFVGAHSTKLTNTGKIAGNLDNDGARICQRWWFA